MTTLGLVRNGYCSGVLGGESNVDGLLVDQSGILFGVQVEEVTGFRGKGESRTFEKETVVGLAKKLPLQV
jgi:hypothetical protein